MKLRPGLSALVTGGASNIGRTLVLALARNGVFVTVADTCEEKGREVVSQAQKESSKFYVLMLMDFPPVQFVKCDVTDSIKLAAVFKNHVETYGGLDICITCAGIVTSIPFHKDESDWKRTVNVNFGAVVDTTRLAVQAMQEAKRHGAIIHVASAPGLYPMYHDPVYSGSKAAVMSFTKTLAPYKHPGIRVNALFLEFVRTELANKISPVIADLYGSFWPMETVVKGALELISDESRAGSCLSISNKTGFIYTPSLAQGEYSEHRNKKSVGKVAVRIDATFRHAQAKL